MVDEDFWGTVRVRRRAANKSTGVINIALLFGTAAIAFSLIITPMLAGKSDNRRTARSGDDFDMITTGSITKQPATGKNYTIRRSVLQDTPGSVCIVQGYGGENGC